MLLFHMLMSCPFRAIHLSAGAFIFEIMPLFLFRRGLPLLFKYLLLYYLLLSWRHQSKYKRIELISFQITKILPIIHHKNKPELQTAQSPPWLTSDIRHPLHVHIRIIERSSNKSSESFLFGLVDRPLLPLWKVEADLIPFSVVAGQDVLQGGTVELPPNLLEAYFEGSLELRRYFFCFGHRVDHLERKFNLGSEVFLEKLAEFMNQAEVKFFNFKPLKLFGCFHIIPNWRKATVAYLLVHYPVDLLLPLVHPLFLRFLLFDLPFRFLHQAVEIVITHRV